jgi:hypothetical protein
MRKGLFIVVAKRGRPAGVYGEYKKRKRADELRKARSFRASDDEWEIIKANAARVEMNISSFIRHRTLPK